MALRTFRRSGKNQSRLEGERQTARTMAPVRMLVISLQIRVRIVWKVMGPVSFLTTFAESMFSSGGA